MFSRSISGPGKTGRCVPLARMCSRLPFLACRFVRRGSCTAGVKRRKLLPACRWLKMNSMTRLFRSHSFAALCFTFLCVTLAADNQLRGQNNDSNRVGDAVEISQKFHHEIRNVRHVDAIDKKHDLYFNMATEMSLPGEIDHLAHESPAAPQPWAVGIVRRSSAVSETLVGNN